MKINDYERRVHIVADSRDIAASAWHKRDLGPEVRDFSSIRPCGVDIGKCWVVTYRVNNTRNEVRA